MVEYRAKLHTNNNNNSDHARSYFTCNTTVYFRYHRQLLSSSYTEYALMSNDG